MSKYGWKFAVRLADGRIVSDYDNTTEWKRGEWNKVAAPSRECVGLNDSPTIGAARRYVQRAVLLRTEHAGATIKSGDKTTGEKMRALHAYDVSDYDAKVVPLYKDYDAKIALLGKDYDAKVALLGKDYDAKVVPLGKDYYAKIALLGKDYDAKVALLDKDYDAKRALLDKDYDAKRAEFTTKERWIW
jgi:hypothetical protein